MNEAFVDHLQLLPVPSRGGVRQPDGAHRPGGLGLRTLSDRLEPLGWTARIEDFGFEHRVPERRIAESYARAVGDAVVSAWDRSRFPILLSLVDHGALGIVDGFGSEIGIAWVSPRPGYAGASRIGRNPPEPRALALVTGRAPRDRMAVEPRSLSGSRIVVVDGRASRRSERRALAEDGIRVVAAARLGELPQAVAAIDSEDWYVHVDANALDAIRAPAADRPAADGLDPEALADRLADAVEGRRILALGITHYDLNRDGGDVTAATLVELIDRLLLAAGGQPDPERRALASAG